MKDTILVLLLLCFLTGCHHQKPTHQETVTAYYKAFDSGDYTAIRALIHDTLTVTVGDYVTPYTHDSFYTFFKWDSIFQTSYAIVDLEEKSDHIMATVASKSLRYAFLKNNPLTCRFTIVFNSGKISRIESGECVGADWDIWEKKRDSLVGWIKKNHPYLDGFINDMTMDGAIHYLKAIELYKMDKTAFQQPQIH